MELTKEQYEELKSEGFTAQLLPVNEDNTFAVACFDTNFYFELKAMLKERAADKTDCKNWKITPTEWRESIRSALCHAMAEYEEMHQ